MLHCNDCKKIFNCNSHCPICGFGESIYYKESTTRKQKNEIIDMFQTENDYTFITLLKIQADQLIKIRDAFVFR